MRATMGRRGTQPTNLRAAASTCNGAVAGEGGNAWTYATASMLRDMGVPDALEAFKLMQSWAAEKCSPPWSDEELRTICENAYRYGSRGAGA